MWQDALSMYCTPFTSHINHENVSFHKPLSATQLAQLAPDKTCCNTEATATCTQQEDSRSIPAEVYKNLGSYCVCVCIAYRSCEIHSKSLTFFTPSSSILATTSRACTSITISADMIIRLSLLSLPRTKLTRSASCVCVCVCVCV